MPGPTPTSSPARYPLGRVASWQLIASLGIAAVGGLWSGLHGALSGLLGGIVNISAIAVYAVLVRLGNVSSPGAAVRTMIRAEAAKIMVIVLQLWLVLTTYKDVVHAVFFSAFVVTVLVSTAAILIRD